MQQSGDRCLIFQTIERAQNGTCAPKLCSKNEKVFSNAKVNETLIIVLDSCCIPQHLHTQLLSALLVLSRHRFSCWDHGRLWHVCIFPGVNQDGSQWTENCHVSVKIAQYYIRLGSAIRRAGIPAGTGIHICLLAFLRWDKGRWKKKLGRGGLAGQLDGD